MRKTIFILVAFFLLVFPNLQLAQQTQGVQELKVIAPTPTLSEKTINYQLPYPGLLPDNPLYFLKATRDKLISFFVADPLKKADLDLLNADKRLNAAFYLFNSAKQKDSAKQNKKKISLVVSTISKAENYFGESLKKVHEAKKQGMDTADILSRLLNASLKYQEIIKDLEKQSPVFKNDFWFLEKRLLSFTKEVEELRLR